MKTYHEKIIFIAIVLVIAFAIFCGYKDISSESTKLEVDFYNAKLKNEILDLKIKEQYLKKKLEVEK